MLATNPTAIRNEVDKMTLQAEQLLLKAGKTLSCQICQVTKLFINK